MSGIGHTVHTPESGHAELRNLIQIRVFSSCPTVSLPFPYRFRENVVYAKRLLQLVGGGTRSLLCIRADTCNCCRAGPDHVAVAHEVKVRIIPMLTQRSQRRAKTGAPNHVIVV